MKINNVYTQGLSNANPFGVKFKTASSSLQQNNGKSLWSLNNIEVPENWAQISVDILAQKYFRKSGVPTILKPVPEQGIPTWLQRHEPDLEKLNKLPHNQRYTGEISAKQVFRRLAGAWTYHGYKNNYFDTEEDALHFFNELQYILANQMAAPNSPQWFNTGLHWAYGITGGSQGHFYFDETTNKIKKSSSAYERPQPHACFIQSIQDDLVNEGGIMDLAVKEARLFKYGSGTGTNFSNLRGSGEQLSGGGKSSGLMSFLKILDVSAGAIKSGGTTRRAAKMVILDVDHPDIEEFIEWKVKEEQKVVSLVTGSIIANKTLTAIVNACQNYNGNMQDATDVNKNEELKKAIFLAKNLYVPEKYIQRTLQLIKRGNYTLQFDILNTDWTSEAYQTVSGQNSNNSVRLSNKFINSVQNNKPWQLINRTNKEVAKEVNAKAIWDKINTAAWSCADPGLQFSDTINQWHTCPNSGSINGSNPCSEYLFLDDTACNLASINLIHYRNANGSFNTDLFKHTVKLLTMVLEISVTMAQFPSESVAYLSYKFRTLGLGYANIGAYLMSIGVPYDSTQGRNITAAISSLLSGYSYFVSSQMAKEKGAFLGYKENSTEMLRVINNHLLASKGNTTDYVGLDIKPVPLNINAIADKNLATQASTVWQQTLESGKQYGYRNAQVTCIAPTGTIGLLMDCSTTGIEPDFALVKYKSLAGGGYFKIINNTVTMALEYLNYTSQQIADIVNYAVGHTNLQNAPHINTKSLTKLGFTNTQINALNENIKTAFNLNFAFSQYTLGLDFCKNVLKITDEDLLDTNFSILQFLGFTDSQIQEANDYIFGTLTIEGAPHLKEEHLPVFDCANLCGNKGTRYLSYMSHVKMLAAAQSFISGAISKTINMPASATIEDCETVAIESWNLGVKAVALYRDGSKLSQPLQSSLIADSSLQNINFLDVLLNTTIPNIFNNTSVNNKALEIAKYATTTTFRNRPESKRSGYIQKAKIAGHKIYVHTGEYKDGKLAEIFLDCYKEGASFRSIMNSFAIAVSIGLQYGVPLEEYVDAFTFTKFEPSGMVEGHDRIKMSTSMIDFVFRDLAINYLGRYDLGHINTNSNTLDKIQTSNQDLPSIPLNKSSNNNQQYSVVNKNVTDQTKLIDNKGFEAEQCGECNSMTMIRNGTCLVCTTCGTTTGCS